MKLSIASMLSLALGAAAYFPNPAQNPLVATSSNKLPAFLGHAMDKAKAALGGLELPIDAAAAWTEVAKLYPEDTISALQSMTSPNLPKGKEFVRRRPDSHWDSIVHGDELMHSMSGKIDGREKLKGAKLRIKKPNGLGIDEGVNQYSGYLDVEDDKHFFFCKSSAALESERPVLTGDRVL